MLGLDLRVVERAIAVVVAHRAVMFVDETVRDVTRVPRRRRRIEMLKATRGAAKTVERFCDARAVTAATLGTRGGCRGGKAQRCGREKNKTHGNLLEEEVGSEADAPVDSPLPPRDERCARRDGPRRLHH